MEYLYGELDRRTHSALEEHLESCDECRRAVAEWRGAMGELDAWQVEAKRPLVLWLRPALRWAVAALLLLAVGFGVGRVSSRGTADTEELRAEWRAALADAESRLKQDIRADVQEDMNEMALATLSAAKADTTRLLNRYAAAFDSTRRDDLLTFAALTEQEFARTRRQMASVLTYTYPEAAVPEPPSDQAQAD